MQRSLKRLIGAMLLSAALVFGAVTISHVSQPSVPVLASDDPGHHGGGTGGG